MTQDGPEQTRELALQRDVARTALAGLAGFALAGSGAIREHGITDRPTEDVDLFTANQDVTAFSTAVDQVTAQLGASGYQVEQSRRDSQFARLHVATEDGLHLDVDLGVDWRENEPVTLDVGPVLSVADAVGNKVAALYGRGEARDYLDVDTIRASGRFSDEELVTAAAERDPGFDVGMFARQLAAVSRLQPAQVARYGVTAEQLGAVKVRCAEWAAVLAEQVGTESAEDRLRRVTDLMRAGFPMPATEAVRRPPEPAPQARPPQGRRKPWSQERGLER